jgi:hypothetical protein
MATITSDQIHAFLTELGSRYQQQATLHLLGGSALCLLGSERPTLDIDYVGSDLHKNALQHSIEQVAQELRIPVDAVPIAQFVPMPTGADDRQLLIGRFGSIEVHVLDPYTIALSKLDRGFETDIDDIVFLIHGNLITFEQLERFALTALKRASEFNMSVEDVHAHLQAVRNLLR